MVKDADKVQRRDTTLFLGAEGLQETEGQPWIRPATDAEIEALRKETTDGLPEADAREKWQNMSIDRIGRPYFLVTVLGSAPDEVWRVACGHLRMKRLPEYGEEILR